MESASLIFLAASLGIVFGWQPMPDGSSKYEYIVQLDPDLVAALEEGQSIPITSDIPSEIGPVGRIRIVVGRDELPRQKLVTQFKPLPELIADQSQNPIVETQFLSPTTGSQGTDRYGNRTSNPAEILPPENGNTMSSSTDAFARSLQQGAQSTNNQATHNNQATQILPNKVGQILPPGNEQPRNLGQSVQAQARELFGNKKNNSISPPTNSQETSILTGPSIHRGGSANSSTSNGSLAPPFTGQNGNSASTAAILPPSTTDKRPSGNRSPGNGSPGSRSTGNHTQFIGSDHLNQTKPTSPNNNWAATNNQQPTGQQLPPGTHPITAGPINTNPVSSTPNNLANSHGAQNNSWPPVPATKQPFASNGANLVGNSSHNNAHTMATYPAGSPSNQSTGLAQQNPILPNSTGANVAGQKPNSLNNNTLQEYKTANTPNNTSQPASDSLPNSTWPPAPDNTASIHKHMLKNPAGAPIQTADGKSLMQPPKTQLASLPATQTTEKIAPQNPQTNLNTNHPAENKTDPVFPLLLSWVLLSGSVAGNVYLFWNYFDMRGKYSNLIYEKGEIRGPGQGTRE